MTNSSTASLLTPQEQAAQVAMLNTSLSIGIPKERGFQENRVALSPQSVKLLVALGYQILIESQAGESSYFADIEYSEAGAIITTQVKEVYRCNILIKVGPIPQEEIVYLKPGQIIFSALHLPTLNHEYFNKLIDKKVTAIAYEYLKDLDGSLPVVRSMSEIAGISSVLIAAEYVSNRYQGFGKLLGGITGIPPNRVVILGAGNVGLYAARTAIGLGAEVRVFDNSLSKLRRLQHNLGQRVYTSVIQPDLLAYELMRADVAIGAIHSEKGRTLMIVTEEMVSKMKPGSIIIDVSIDQGGCFETSELTTHSRPTFRKYNVIHYCVPNIPSRVSQTASMALSNILAPLFAESAENGGIEHYLWLHKGLRAGVYLYNGNVANKYLAQKFNTAFYDLEIITNTRY